MASTDEVSRPLVIETTPLSEVIYEMSRKGLGMTCVVDTDERLVGLVTDGDLRLSEARSLMDARRITSVPVVDAHGHVTGIVHIHDLWASAR